MRENIFWLLSSYRSHAREGDEGQQPERIGDKKSLWVSQAGVRLVRLEGVHARDDEALAGVAQRIIQSTLRR